MALNIKDPETEALAAEVAALTGESKTRAVREALRERRERLTREASRQRTVERLHSFLADEVWPQIPDHLRGRTITKQEREQLLGYGPEGYEP